jgi:hypothetical protein
LGADSPKGESKNQGQQNEKKSPCQPDRDKTVSSEIRGSGIWRGFLLGAVEKQTPILCANGFQGAQRRSFGSRTVFDIENFALANKSCHLLWFTLHFENEASVKKEKQGKS